MTGPTTAAGDATARLRQFSPDEHDSTSESVTATLRRPRPHPRPPSRPRRSPWAPLRAGPAPQPPAPGLLSNPPWRRRPLRHRMTVGPAVGGRRHIRLLHGRRRRTPRTCLRQRHTRLLRPLRRRHPGIDPLLHRPVAFPVRRRSATALAPPFGGLVGVAVAGSVPAGVAIGGDVLDPVDHHAGQWSLDRSQGFDGAGGHGRRVH